MDFPMFIPIPMSISIWAYPPFELNAQRSLKCPLEGGWVLIKKKFFLKRKRKKAPLVTIQLGGYAQIEIEIEIEIEIDIDIRKSVELKMLLQDG